MKREFIAFLSHDVDVPVKYNFIGVLVELKRASILFLKLNFKKSFKLFFDIIFSILTNKNPYWQFEKIMELEKSYGYRSTFFFCVKRRHKLDPYYNIKDKKIIRMIKRLDGEGFEIGLHGSYLSYQNLSYLKEEKRILEKILGKEVIGIRQHFMNFNESTPGIQSEAGFKYDSSYGYTDRLGYKNERFNPFYFGDLLEIPLVVMDGNIGKMGLNGEEAWSETKSLIDFARKNNYLITFDWHERFLSNEEFPMFAKLYKKILAYLKETGAEVLTAGQICQKWQKLR